MFSEALLILTLFEQFSITLAAEVSTSCGKIAGQAVRYEGGRAYAFKGIPYAEYIANSRYTPLSLVSNLVS